MAFFAIGNCFSRIFSIFSVLSQAGAFDEACSGIGNEPVKIKCSVRLGVFARD